MALKDVGVKLVVQGLSTFKSSLSDATRSLDGIGESITANSSQLQAFGLATAGAGAAITAGLGLSVNAAADFEQAITNAVSVTGYMGDEADAAKLKMEDLARELGESTAFSATEVANAMYDLASKGFKPAEMSVKELTGFLDIAAATQSDLAFTTQTVTSTLRAFGLNTSESGRISDVFAKTIGSSAATMEKLGTSMAYVAPVAKAAGMSLEETSAFLGALYNTGLDASMAGTALRGVLAELMDPSTDLMDSLDEMGLTLEDVDLSTNSVTDILEKLQKAGMTNAQVMSVFGKRAGPAALSLMGVNESGVATIDTIKELTNTLGEAGGTAQNMAEMQLDTMNGEWTLMNSALTEVMITIGNELLPILTELGGVITDILRPIGEWMNDNEELSKILVIVAGAVGTLMAALGAFLIILPGLVTAVEGASVVMTALGVAMDVALGPIGLIILAIAAVAAGAYLIYDNWDAISDFFVDLWDSVVDAFQWAWNFIVDLVKEHWDLILAVIFPAVGLPILIARHWGEIVDVISGIWDTVVGFFQDNWQLILGIIFPAYGLYQLVTDNWGLITDAVREIWDKVKETTLNAGKAIWHVFTSNWPWLFSGGALFNAFTGIYDKMRGVWNSIKDFLKGMATTIWHVFTSNWKWLFKDGALWNAIGGVYEWFKEKFNGMINVAKSVANSVIGVFNSAIGLISGKELFSIGEKKIAGVTVFPGFTLTMPSIPKIPTLASGGDILKGGMALVGEAGPELVSLPTGASVHPITNNYNITENYARPESPQSLNLSLQALAMYART